MKNDLIKEMDKVNYFNISEDEILDNDRIKVYVVENKTDTYNEIARVMANKIKENNQKGILTSFTLPVGPRGQYKRFAAILMSKELRFYLEHNWQSVVLRKATFEKLTPSFPATFLKEHKNSSITLSENVLRRYVC